MLRYIFCIDGKSFDIKVCLECGKIIRFDGSSDYVAHVWTVTGSFDLFKAIFGIQAVVLTYFASNGRNIF